MAYTPTNWQTGDVVTASKLNKLENAVDALDTSVTTNTGDITDLKSEINEVEAGFPQKSASGSIVSISDGADNVPVVSLTADIDPVQDLHGYENPWPAGGGSNRWDEDWKAGHIVSGEEVSDGTYRLISKNYIPVTAGERYYFKGPTGIGATVFGYDSEKAYVSIVYDANSTNVGFDVPDTVSYLKFQMYSGYGSTASLTYNNDIAINYPSTVSTYSPYQNNCPISGWTGANVFDAGKNLLDLNNCIDNLFPSVSSGIFTIVDGTSTFYANVKPNSVYTLSANNGDRTIICSCDAIPSNGLAIKRTIINSGSFQSPTTFMTADDETLVAIYVNRYTTTKPTEIQLELGSTATDYVPYTGNTVSITFPAGAGTVYGGTLTLNQDGTADLTVDHATVDLGTLDWQYDDNVGHERFQAALSAVKPSGGAVASLWCSDYKVTTAGEIYQHAYDFAIAIHGTLPQVWVYDTRYTDKTTFKAAMDGVQAVYELATPQTYHLTDVELVKTLYLLNNIWADTGDVSLTYRADPATYTAEQIQTMLNAMVAPVEATTTASKAYSVNDFLIMNNVLYKVTANIANGGTITIDTNVSATTIGAEITAILNT